VPRQGGGEEGRPGGGKGGKGKAGSGEHLTPKTEGGQEGPGLEEDTAITVRSEGVGETPGEKEACCERSEAPSPASSSEEGLPTPSTRPGRRGPGGSGSEMATGGGESIAMVLTG